MMISDEILSRARILVIDDEQANVRLLERLVAHLPTRQQEDRHPQHVLSESAGAR